MSEPAPLFAYTVRAEISDPRTAASYTDWLVSGHVRAVLRAGARSADVLDLGTSDGVQRIEVRYLFDSRAVFDTYERDHAPALRAEGLGLFGTDGRIEWSRTTGTMLLRCP